MSESSNIYLPADTRISDIVNVMGILIGLEKKWNPKGWVDVPEADGYSFVANYSDASPETKIFICPSMPQMFLGHIRKTTLDNENHMFYYHMELSQSDGMPKDGKMYKMISAGVSPFWKAVGRGLVDFFGGYIDDNDCYGDDFDYHKAKPRKHNNPSDNKEWADFHAAMFSIKPIEKL